MRWLSGYRVVALSALIAAVACSRPLPLPPPTPAPTLAVAPGPPLPATLQEARAALAAGKSDLYELALRALAGSPDPQTSRRAWALLGLFYIDQKRAADALPLLDRAAELYPEVAPWLRLRIAELQREAGRYPEAIAATMRITREAPKTSAATIARLRLPALQALAGDTAGTETSIKEAMTVKIDELSEEQFVNLAADLDKSGRHDLADPIRIRLLTQYPQGRFTEKTYDLGKSALDALSVADALDVARKLGGAEHYDQALDLLQRIAQRSPALAESSDYSTFRLRALFNSRHYADLLMETDERKLGDPALILLRARAAWRADQPKEFLSGLKRIERKFPKSPESAEAKVLRAKYYSVDEPKLDLAIENLEKAIKAAGSGNEGETLWTLGWTCLLDRRYDDALQIFDRYGREFPDGEYRTNALFWSGKIHDRLGRSDLRDAAFSALLTSYPYSYYSYRTREILRQPAAAPSEVASGNIFPNVDEEIAAVRETRIDSVRELASLTLYRDATRELKSIMTAYPDNAGMAFMLADLYSEGGEPLRAIVVLQRRFRPFIRHGGTGVPRRFWEILFPLKYWEIVRAEAQRRQIDPYLVASIIRQESGFEPATVSSAGAVGIMQIMPADAAPIAAAAGLGAPTRQQLFDPATNIAIGVAEYAQKLGVMQGTTLLAIAAYNAGEEAVGKWLAQTPVDDVDLFIESIPYNETRLYVKSVTRNRFEYRRIYEVVSSSS